MVVLTNTEGKFGHQLSQYATLLAYAIRFKKKFYYPAFYRKYSPVFKNDGLREYDGGAPGFRVLAGEMIFRVLGFFVRSKTKLGRMEFYLYPKTDKKLIFDQTLEAMFRSDAGLVFTDRMFNDIPNLVKYRPAIRSLLRFEDELAGKTTRFIRELRQQHDHIVCVHIRQGDFRFFSGGQFYFDEQAYAGILKRFLEIAGLDRNKTAVIICSDEKIGEQAFEGIPVWAGQRPYAEDFLLMQQCDYLIACRSIFSTMANYLGDSRIYQFTDARADFTMDDFQDCETFLQQLYNYKEMPVEVSGFKMQRWILIRKIISKLKQRCSSETVTGS
jgi:Glycosyl transferase family 11